MLLHLIGMGYFADERPDFKALNALAELYANMGEPVPAKYPLYGRDAHRAGNGLALSAHHHYSAQHWRCLD